MPELDKLEESILFTDWSHRLLISYELSVLDTTVSFASQDHFFSGPEVDVAYTSLWDFTL